MGSIFRRWTVGAWLTAAVGAGLIASAVTAGCTVPPAPVLRPDVQPLGRTWTYRVSDRQGAVLGQIVSKIVAAEGTKLTQETTETFNGVTTTRRSIATFQPDGSLLVEDNDGKVSPLPSVRQRLTPGASWENPDGTKVTVEIQETVTVPAGSYVAYRLRQRKGETTIVDWFYPA
ncbi:MAG: hypothetical protein H7338_07555, partial [Candidatus Sericytochromatia bacterium]|nr:hypothetical protein [Candidatus Sericytochromatia bacterium]